MDFDRKLDAECAISWLMSESLSADEVQEELDRLIAVGLLVPLPTGGYKVVGKLLPDGTMSMPRAVAEAIFALPDRD